MISDEAFEDIIRDKIESTGEQYTEFRMRGRRIRIVVQSTGHTWYIYRIDPREGGAVRTIGATQSRADSELIARGYALGMCGA